MDEAQFFGARTDAGTAGCRWECCPRGNPNRRHVTAKSRSLVAAKVKKLEQARDSGAVGSTGRTTVAGYLAEWIARKVRMGSVRPLTLSGYRTDERHIVDAIGTVRLDRLRTENVEHLWSYMLDRGLSIAHCRRTLNAALKDAMRRGILGLMGEQSIAPTTIEALQETIKQAQLVEIPGTGHFVHLDAPMAFNHAIEEFLATIV
jgi:pimeloyl-ACP methyl ester carboxylesterase